MNIRGRFLTTKLIPWCSAHRRLIAAVIFAVVGISITFFLRGKQPYAIDAVELRPPISYSSSSLDSDNKTILLLGDTSFGENYQEERRTNILKEKGYSYSLDRFKLLLGSADRVLANLETPVTDLRTSDLVGIKSYIHWADPRLTPLHLASHNIRYVSLANNHAMDLGVDGLAQTIKALSDHEIEFFGAGFNQIEAERPLIWQIDGNDADRRILVFAGYEYVRRYDERFRFYAGAEAAGVCTFQNDALKKRIAQVKEEDPSTFIICFPHWGENYKQKTPAQKALAHAWIDAGANLVVGHGAHMAQEIEYYQGSWIIYSLGNFMFNSGGRYDRFNVPPISLITRVVLASGGSEFLKEIRLYPIYTNNPVTNFQSRFVENDEFETAIKLVGSRIYPDKRMSFGKDAFGRYIRLQP